MSNTFVILQTKEVCQSLFDSKIFDKSKNVQNEFINTDKNKNVVLNVHKLIMQAKIRFLFNLKNFFSMTRRKAFKKRLKNRLLRSKKSFEKLNQSLRFEIKEHRILFK